MLSFAGNNTKCHTWKDVRIVPLPWYEVTAIRQSYRRKGTTTGKHGLALKTKVKLVNCAFVMSFVFGYCSEMLCHF